MDLIRLGLLFLFHGSFGDANVNRFACRRMGMEDTYPQAMEYSTDSLTRLFTGDNQPSDKESTTSSLTSWFTSDSQHSVMQSSTNSLTSSFTSDSQSPTMQSSTGFPTTLFTNDASTENIESTNVQYSFPLLSLACLENIGTVTKLFISIKSDQNTTIGKVSFSNKSIEDISFTVDPGQGVYVYIPDTAVSSVTVDSTGSILSDTAVFVSAVEAVSVYVHQSCDYTNGRQCGTTYPVKKIHQTGTEYWILMQYIAETVKIGVLSYEDGNVVEVTTPESQAGLTLSRVVDAHQTLYLGYSSDMSGTKINSSGPILVFISYQFRTQLTSCTSHVGCLEPVSRWDSDVAFMKSFRDQYAYFKLLSPVANSINVTSKFGDEEILSVSAGEVVVRDFGSRISDLYVLEFKAESPILVIQMIIDKRLTMFVPPVSVDVTEVVFPVVPVAGTNYFLLVLWLSEKGNYTQVIFDGVENKNSPYDTVNRYPLANIYVEPGIHVAKTINNVRIIKASLYNEGEDSERLHWYSLL